MAKRLSFLCVVLGLVLMGSVVAGQVMVDADEVVASPAEVATPEAEAASQSLVVENGGANGQPTCTYPDDCPPPKPVECQFQIEAFGTVIGVDDSSGENLTNFAPNYRISVTGCEVAGIVFNFFDQPLGQGSGSVLEVKGNTGVCPDDPYAYRIDVLGDDGSIIDVEQLLLGDEEGACSDLSDEIVCALGTTIRTTEIWARVPASVLTPPSDQRFWIGQDFTVTVPAGCPPAVIRGEGVDVAIVAGGDTSEQQALAVVACENGVIRDDTLGSFPAISATVAGQPAGFLILFPEPSDADCAANLDPIT